MANIPFRFCASVIILLATWRIMSSSSTGESIWGVYHSIDPSTYSEIYPENPSPEIEKIAKLYTALIQLFVDMRYLKSEYVQFPPHTNLPVSTTYPAKYGFTKDVVDLYQMLPYVKERGRTNWNYGSDGGEFIMGGEFMYDMRDDQFLRHNWELIIDPMYGIQHLTGFAPPRGQESLKSDWDAEKGPYIKPWYAVLSSCGNHGSTMILDTKSCM
jgi:hypothetical protein